MNESTKTAGNSIRLTGRQAFILKAAMVAFSVLVILASISGYFKIAFGLIFAGYLVLGYRKLKKHKQSKAGGSAA